MSTPTPTWIHGSRGYWYNYDTQEAHHRDAPQTTDEALPYIPTGARGLFVCYVELGDTVLEAMLKTLSRCIGKPID